MADKRHYDLHANICKVLSHPKRLELLDHLREGEKTVTELAEALTVPQSTLSRYLSVMRSTGMVIPRRQAMNIYYRLSNPKIIESFDIMGQVVLDHLKEGAKMAEAIRG